MPLADYPELQKLPRHEQFALADELIQAGIAKRAPLTAEQKETLDGRWADYQAGKTKPISLTELERRLDSRTK
jgi:putative addiction module component (TIGR02574 family)